MANKIRLLKQFALIAGLVTTANAVSLAHAAVSEMQVNALILQAIETHPSVNAAVSDQEATEQGIKAAKLNLLPTPSLSTGYDSTSSELVTTAALRQTLWAGGRLTANVNQAIFDDKAAVEGVYVKQNEVAKTTIDAWQTYIAAVAQQRVYDNNLHVLSDFEEMMKRRVEQGVSARIDLKLISNRILQEQNKRQAAHEQQRIATARLEQIIGQSISEGSAVSVPRMTELVDAVKQQSINFESLAFNEASNNISFYNPSVVKAAYEIESAKQKVRADRSALYPAVYAQYAYEYKHESHDKDGQFSLGMDYSPGAGFSNIALSKASQARVNSLSQSKEATRRTVMEEIQVQYQQFASTKDQERSLMSAAAGAKIVVDSYRRQFVAGRKSWLDVLNAIRELGDYEAELVQTRAEMVGAFYKLQVDFSLMPWQQFQQNREPTELFSPIREVKSWAEERVPVLNNDNPL